MQQVSSRARFLLVFPLALALLPASASAAFGPWTEGQQARARLLAAGIGADGRLDAAIEIELEPGWKTYWRTPGDAGIPPRIDFGGSANAGAADVSFPVPTRADDGFAATNTYEDRLTLPVSIAVPDPSAPVGLRLALDIGVCAEVCVPEHFDVALDLAPGASDAVAAKRIAAARALVPGPSEPGVLAVEGIARAGGTDEKPAFDVTVDSPTADPELFLEGPSDWFAGAPKKISDDGGRYTYRVIFDRLGAKTPIAGSEVRVTIVSGDRAVEQTVVIN